MNNGVMKYRGYSAVIAYSEEDECLVGKVVDVNDSITFHGDSVAEMKKEMKLSVDAYLKACEKFGKDPERPYSGKMNLRLPPEMHKVLVLEAEQTGKSINDLIVMAVDATYTGEAATVTKAKPQSRRAVKRRQ